MPRKPSSKNTQKRKTPRELSHHATDILGICSLSFATIMILSLGLGNTGIIGHTLGQFFQVLFGKGAWISPLLFIFLGISLLTGKQNLNLNRTVSGLILIFLSIIGSLAKHYQGDYFDAQIAAESGGYLGAVVGYVADHLIGNAKPIGLITLGSAGLVICLNDPLRAVIKIIWERFHKRITVPKSQAKPEPVSRVKIKALQDYEEDPRTTPPIEKRTPRFKEPEIPNLFDTSSQPTPKEGYNLPPVALLAEATSPPKRSPQEMQTNIDTLEGTLEQFKIDANVVEVATGPTITRYEIQLGPGIRVSRITALADNIAMNLAASAVRVEAPIPGKSAIGVEVPNAQPTMVQLRKLVENKEFIDHPSRLAVALGQDVSGVNKYADLTKMPHLLIGGATNSGKSIGLATIITSLLMRNTPKDVKMVMIDPKRVELSLFDGIPHLMCPVVKDVKEAPGVLRAVWKEMDRRYDVFSEAGVRNIDGWNEKASFQDKMSYIVVVIDELADLMIQAAAEVETSICRLAQLARATGIHLVIATQRPSVDVITGTIKANIASRIAFAVSSQIDSRTIMDQAGAERLIGKGDMLFMPIGANKPTRIQGCYVSEKEIEDVCTHWKDQESPQYVLNPVDLILSDREADIADQESDPLWEEAVRWVADRGQASTSMLQRRFSIGFQRASRLLDMMEERRIVGPRDGPRPRDVLVDPGELDAMFGTSRMV